MNAAFSRQWEAKTGQKVTIKQSNGGSGKQARAIIDGLPADVATLALAYDLDVLYEKARLIPRDWQKRLPNNSAPYTSTIVFLVRDGNPKGIKDWGDLVKPGISVVTPNPKTSGGGIGDVLVAWESEALLAVKEARDEKFEIVVPSLSILAEPPVTIVDKIADRRGTRQVAQAYLEFLYSEAGQEIVARNFYRPRLESVARKYENVFPRLTLFTIEDRFGGWQKAQQVHFHEGGVFDQICQPVK